MIKKIKKALLPAAACPDGLSGMTAANSTGSCWTNDAKTCFVLMHQQMSRHELKPPGPGYPRPCPDAAPGKLGDMQETKPPAHPQRARLVVPSRSDLLLKNFTELIGGPMGARSAPGLVSPGVFTVERVLIILTVLAALAGIADQGLLPGQRLAVPRPVLFHVLFRLPGLFPEPRPGRRIRSRSSARAAFLNTPS